MSSQQYEEGHAAPVPVGVFAVLSFGRQVYHRQPASSGRCRICDFFVAKFPLSSFKGVDSFSAQIDSRKARERDLATLDKKSTSSGIAEPYAR